MNSNILKQTKYEAVIWISGILRLNISTISYQDFWSKMFGYRYFISTHTTIIIKTVGKAATFNLFFSFLPTPPAPCPMLSKKLMFVHVIIILLYPNIEWGDWGYLAKEKTLFFTSENGLLLSFTTFPT